VGLVFAVAVPRRSANDLEREVAVLPDSGRGELERAAA
jgi:hypothetical protein